MPMNEVLSILKSLKDPALVVAGATIIILFKLLLNADKALDSFRVEFAEFNKTQAKMVTLLDLLCSKQLSRWGG